MAARRAERKAAERPWTGRDTAADATWIVRGRVRLAACRGRVDGTGGRELALARGCGLRGDSAAAADVDRPRAPTGSRRGKRHWTGRRSGDRSPRPGLGGLAPPHDGRQTVALGDSFGLGREGVLGAARRARRRADVSSGHELDILRRRVAELDILRRRVAAPPRVPRGYSVGSGDAQARHRRRARAALARRRHPRRRRGVPHAAVSRRAPPRGAGLARAPEARSRGRAEIFSLRNPFAAVAASTEYPRGAAPTRLQRRSPRNNTAGTRPPQARERRVAPAPDELGDDHARRGQEPPGAPDDGRRRLSDAAPRPRAHRASTTGRHGPGRRAASERDRAAGARAATRGGDEL